MQCMSRVGIGTPPPLPQESVALPLEPEEGEAHSPAGEGVGESRFQRLEKKFSTLSTLACGRGGGANSDEGTDPVVL